MSRSFGPYGMKPLDTFNSTSGTTYSTVSVNINNPSETKSNLVCISGTLSATNDSNQLRGSLKSANEANYTQANSYTHCPYSSTVQNLSNYTLFTLSRFDVGNANATSQVDGERANVIIWIVSNESTVAPIVNTMVYSWISPEYTVSAYHTLPCWNVVQVTQASKSDEFVFYWSSGNVSGARLKSWGWGGD